MKQRFAIIVGALALLSSGSATGVTIERTSAAECMVIEAAYTAAIKSRTSVHPAAIERGWRTIEMQRIVPEYRAKLPLSSKEFDDLAAREKLYNVAQFEPRCEWKSHPTPTADDELHPMTVSFTNPIMSVDKHLALLEVSFSDHKGFGYGSMCIARLRGNDWRAQCISSWIT